MNKQTITAVTIKDTKRRSVGSTTIMTIEIRDLEGNLVELSHGYKDNPYRYTNRLNGEMIHDDNTVMFDSADKEEWYHKIDTNYVWELVEIVVLDEAHLKEL